jgi:uncharacterized coiled-coil protein SlyX
MDEYGTLSAKVWAAMPAAVAAYLAFQDNQIALLREQVGSLEGELAKLRLHLAEAQARIKQYSGNSSRPPSSDPPSAPPRPPPPPSGRKRGGQKGHPGHARLQLANAELSAVVEHRPLQCPVVPFPWIRRCRRRANPSASKSGRFPSSYRRSSSIAAIGCAVRTVPRSFPRRTCRRGRLVRA